MKAIGRGLYYELTKVLVFPGICELLNISDIELFADV